jgi:hypothetical protein
MGAGETCWYCGKPTADVLVMAGEQLRWVCADHFDADEQRVGDKTAGYDHGRICVVCGLRAGIHAAQGWVYVRIRPRSPGYEVACSCGRLFGSESSGEKALDPLRGHVAAVEACTCSCHAGTHSPSDIGDRGD